MGYNHTQTRIRPGAILCVRVLVARVLLDLLRCWLSLLVGREITTLYVLGYMTIFY